MPPLVRLPRRNLRSNAPAGRCRWEGFASVPEMRRTNADLIVAPRASLLPTLRTTASAATTPVASATATAKSSVANTRSSSAKRRTNAARPVITSAAARRVAATPPAARWPMDPPPAAKAPPPSAAAATPASRPMAAVSMRIALAARVARNTFASTTTRFARGASLVVRNASMPICEQINANCDDGSACTSNICNAAGACEYPFNCNLSEGCCVDPDPCTANICNQNGTCSFPFFCSSNDCCDDGNACTQNICNTGAGTCSYPFYCTSDDCCEGDTVCDTGSGACYTPCADFGEECAGIGCCSADNYCYSLFDAASICGPCIPSGTPCLGFCEFCCVRSYLGVCVSCGLQFSSCENGEACCSGFYCQYNPVGDNFCSVDI